MLYITLLCAEQCSCRETKRIVPFFVGRLTFFRCRSSWDRIKDASTPSIGMYPQVTSPRHGDRLFRRPPALSAPSPSFPPRKSSVLDKSTTSSVSNAVSQPPTHPLSHLPMRLFSVSCNTLLNSGNINEHEKKIYCVGCYRRQFGPQGGECAWDWWESKRRRCGCLQSVEDWAWARRRVWKHHRLARVRIECQVLWIARARIRMDLDTSENDRQVPHRRAPRRMMILVTAILRWTVSPTSVV